VRVTGNYSNDSARMGGPGRDWRRWRAEHRYRLEQARLQFTGGTTPQDKV
jgi:hypothetical protein